jgi:hypothetical protein
LHEGVIEAYSRCFRKEMILVKKWGVVFFLLGFLSGGPILSSLRGCLPGLAPAGHNGVATELGHRRKTYTTTEAP